MAKIGVGMSKEMYEHICNTIHTLELDLKNGKILNRKAKWLRNGYLEVRLMKKAVYQHQVFAVARWGKACIGMTVNHISGVKTDNSWDNLELLTHGENNKAMMNRSGGNGPKQPIKAINIDTMEEHLFESQMDASKQLGVDRSSIYYVLKGRRNHAGGYKFERVAE